jgi:hypothetical protein
MRRRGLELAVNELAFLLQVVGEVWSWASLFTRHGVRPFTRVAR